MNNDDKSIEVMDCKVQKINTVHDEIEYLGEILRFQLTEARKDYEAKKKAKGEEVNYFKMINAINQRKKVKEANKKYMEKFFGSAGILLSRE